MYISLPVFLTSCKLPRELRSCYSSMESQSPVLFHTPLIPGVNPTSTAWALVQFLCGPDVHPFVNWPSNPAVNWQVLRNRIALSQPRKTCWRPWNPGRKLWRKHCASGWKSWRNSASEKQWVPPVHPGARLCSCGNKGKGGRHRTSSVDGTQPLGWASLISDSSETLRQRWKHVLAEFPVRTSAQGPNDK